jgi:hypothetical protein
MIPDTLEGHGVCVSDHELNLESSPYHQNHVVDGKPKKVQKKV